MATMKTMLAVAALTFIAPHGAMAGNSTRGPVESYQFADIPWGSPFADVDRLLGDKGITITGYPVSSETLKSITARIMSEMGFEVEVIFAIDEKYGLDCVIVITTEDCLLPGGKNDWKCVQERWLAAHTILSRNYGAPNVSEAMLFDVWSSAADGSKLELNSLIGIAYKSPRYQANAARNSLF